MNEDRAQPVLRSADDDLPGFDPARFWENLAYDTSPPADLVVPPPLSTEEEVLPGLF